MLWKYNVLRFTNYARPGRGATEIYEIIRFGTLIEEGMNETATILASTGHAQA